MALAISEIVDKRDRCMRTSVGVIREVRLHMTRHPRFRFVIGIVVAVFGHGCSSVSAGNNTTLRIWAMGREGEVLSQLMPAFEREHPGIHVEVQQIPWTAAHEKLLTAYVGEATPDIAMLGNTWAPEFVALNSLAPLDSLAASSKAIRRDDFFSGIWQTNVVNGKTYGIPWYVDTRVIFYRTDLLAKA